MLWVKSFHIVFVASWFAGLFYLPRIFVNLAMVDPQSTAERERLLLMATKLLRFTSMLSWPAVLLGIWLLVMLWQVPGFGHGPGNGWMYSKLVVVVLAIVYQELCAYRLRRFKAGTEHHGHVWFRWFNEIPVLLLLAAVILVVVKPF
ncbi:MAG: CopD family protein [Rhodoferax sp.]|jgi:protoporphyrinogen IX oxidase|nr:CopD family protein [Rhodoferax sp.]